MIPSYPKIEDITPGEIFQSSLSQSDETNDETPLMRILEDFGTL